MAPLLWWNLFLMFSAMCVMLIVLNYLINLLSKTEKRLPNYKSKNSEW